MKKNIPLLLLVLALIGSCVGEDHFGYSSYGNIKSISVSNQASNAQINNDSLQVIVEIPAGVDLSTIVLTDLQLSSFANADKEIGDTLNLETPQFIMITAEDGSQYNWKVESFIATANPQLDNADLNLWYKTSSDYYEPGKDAASTIWGTGNPGTQILNKLATTPLDVGDNNLASKMETLDNGVLAGTFGAPISAGSIFTGVFDSDKIDPTNPQAAIDFGTPFIGRPLKVQFKYAYQAGDENKNKDGDLLNYNDACDIYALLEVRSAGKVERLATAWFRSEDAQTELITKELEFTYGELDNSFPDYMKPMGEERYVSKDSASFVLPTHVTFVGSSSYDGANFAGAIGSVLVIDDIEFIYE